MITHTLAHTYDDHMQLHPQKTFNFPTPVHSKHFITSCVAEITIVDSSANHTVQIPGGAKGDLGPAFFSNGGHDAVKRGGGEVVYETTWKFPA
jgi:hypothetical protein